MESERLAVGLKDLGTARLEHVRGHELADRLGASIAWVGLDQRLGPELTGASTFRAPAPGTSGRPISPTRRGPTSSRPRKSPGTPNSFYPGKTPAPLHLPAKSCNAERWPKKGHLCAWTPPFAACSVLGVMNAPCAVPLSIFPTLSVDGPAVELRKLAELATSTQCPRHFRAAYRVPLFAKGVVP